MLDCLYTHNYVEIQNKHHRDNTAVVDLVIKNDEKAYMGDIGCPSGVSQ